MPNADGRRRLISHVHDLLCALIGDEVSKMNQMRSVEIHDLCYIKYVQYLDKDGAQLQLLEVLHPLTKCFKNNYLLPECILKPLENAMLAIEKVSAKKKKVYQKHEYDSQR